MALKKPKKYRIVKKVIIAGLITAIMGGSAYGISVAVKNNSNDETLSLTTTESSTSNSYDEYENSSIANDDYGVETDEEKNISYDFTQMKSYYEYQDNEELNALIDQIKKVEFEASDVDFKNYDIVGLTSNELSILKDKAKTYNFKLDKTSYDWYKNGVIDSNKLYDKIISNSKEKGMEITDGLKIITNNFTDNLQGCMNYLKEKEPSYDFTIPLYNINKITVEDIADKDYIAFYDYTKNNFEVDYLYTKNTSLLDYGIIFQTFELLENQSISNGEVYITSFNMDASNTQASPIFWDFIIQRFSEDYTQDYRNIPTSNYQDEEAKMEMIVAATGVSYDEFNNLFLKSDQKGLVQAFEPELQDSETVFSIFEGSDIACGYGVIPDGCDEETFRNNASAYSKSTLLKNFYIKMLKEVYVNGKSVDEAENEILEVKKIILNDRYSPYNMDEETKAALDDFVAKLDNIFYGLKYSI